MLLPEAICTTVCRFFITAVRTVFCQLLVHGSTFALRRKFSAAILERYQKISGSAFIYIGDCALPQHQPPTREDKNNTLEYILGNGMRGDTEFVQKTVSASTDHELWASDGVARIFKPKQIPE
jgi:hypothetical protein